MDKSSTNPHSYISATALIYIYIHNNYSENNIAQFHHMGESKPQQLTKSHQKSGKTVLVLPLKRVPAATYFTGQSPAKYRRRDRA